jgi:hypothetical protein
MFETHAVQNFRTLGCWPLPFFNMMQPILVGQEVRDFFNVTSGDKWCGQGANTMVPPFP